MKAYIFALLTTIAYGVAEPQYGAEYDTHHHSVQHGLRTTPIPILHYNSQRHKEGYQFSFKTGNGIQTQEAGYFKKTGEKEDDNLIVMHGAISYTGSDGVPVKLTYIADEHGFQPQGSHLPTPPSTQSHILKTLQQVDHGHSVAGDQEDVIYDNHQQYGGQYE